MSSIEELVKSLTPVKPARSPLRIGIYWTLFAIAYLFLAYLVRDSNRDQTPLVIGGQFVLIILSGVLAIATASPHEYTGSRRFRLLSLLWVLPVLITIPFIPSTIYFKSLCFMASIAWSVPPIIFMLWIFKRGYALNPFYSVMLGSIAAAGLGSLAQNIACIQLGGWHRILSHTLPALAFAAAVIGCQRVFRMI